jgi:hypothetical protein
MYFKFDAVTSIDTLPDLCMPLTGRVSPTLGDSSALPQARVVVAAMEIEGTSYDFVLGPPVPKPSVSSPAGAFMWNLKPPVGDALPSLVLKKDSFCLTVGSRILE